SGANLTGARLQGAVLRQSMWVRCRWDGAEGVGAHGLGRTEPGRVPWGRVELTGGMPVQRAWRESYTGDWRPDGSCIVAVTSAGMLVAWDAHTRRLLAHLSAGALGARAAATLRWASAADVFVLLSSEGELRVFRERDFREVRPIGGRFQKVAISADGALV